MAANDGGAAGRGRRLARALLLVALAIGCFGGAAASSRVLIAHRPAACPARELMYFPSGRLLDVLALGNDTLAADLVWLRGIQYYGQHRLTDGRYDHIGHVFSVATALDPHFENAYIFGGLVLAAEGNDVEGGIALMKRGLAANPDSHQLAFEIGFLYHVELRDYGHAAYYYRRAARTPGCPGFVHRFAAYACEHSRQPGEALALWEEMAREHDNPLLRRLAAERAATLKRALDGGMVD